MRWAAAVFTLGALAQQTQPPRLASGRVEEAAAGSNLSQQIRSIAGPAWVGYSVAAVPGHRGCCYSVNNGVCSTGCALEGGSYQGAACPVAPAENTAFLEGERSANILLRVDRGEVERVQVFSPSCQLDVGDLSLHWLTGVAPADSIAFLRSIASVYRNELRVVSAIGAHADPAADAFLRETAESQTAERRDRQRAAALLATTRGPAGLALVLRLFESDSDEQFRASIPGALAQAPNGAGISALMDIATKDKSRKVRERAFASLGKSNDPRAQKFVEEILAK